MELAELFRNRLDKHLSGIVKVWEGAVNDCPRYLHQNSQPILNLTGFLISPSDGRRTDGVGLILETYSHGI